MHLCHPAQHSHCPCRCHRCQPPHSRSPLPCSNPLCLKSFVTIKAAVHAHARHARSKTGQASYIFEKLHSPQVTHKFMEAGVGPKGPICWHGQRRLTGRLWPGFHQSCWSQSHPSHTGLCHCHCQSGLPCCCRAFRPLHSNRSRWNHCLHSSRPVSAWIKWSLVATACA